LLCNPNLTSSCLSLLSVGKTGVQNHTQPLGILKNCACVLGNVCKLFKIILEYIISTLFFQAIQLCLQDFLTNFHNYFLGFFLHRRKLSPAFLPLPLSGTDTSRCRSGERAPGLQQLCRRCQLCKRSRPHKNAHTQYKS
jgi:hypothetical protein